MNLTRCPHCGKRLEPEINRPSGCVCDAGEWNDPHNLPPVCDKFEADHVGQNCNRCEHDYGCHAEVATKKRAMTEQEYQSKIPPCCKLQTVSSHVDMLGLCWGITHGNLEREGETYCVGCEMCNTTTKVE